MPKYRNRFINGDKKKYERKNVYTDPILVYGT